MAMSPAAVYRYFASREALLADLVVDAYDDLAEFLESLAAGGGSPLASPRGGRPATSKRASDTDVLAALREFRCLASDAEVMLKN